MLIRKPSYFDRFRCIADRCPDSCCKEWDVCIDPDTAALYRELPGALGQRLRAVMAEEDGNIYMAIENGRCPMWRSDGLCRIQAELGHDTLCKTCRDFPRLTHDYGDFIEYGLELSCPEAARMIFAHPVEPLCEYSSELPETAPEYDAEVMSLLLRSRETALSLLCNAAYAPNEALAILLLFAHNTQQQIDGAEALPFSPKTALRTATAAICDCSMEPMLAFYRQLEILTPQWRGLLNRRAAPIHWSEDMRKLAAYFVQRYWLQAISDWDLVGRAKLAISACLIIGTLGGVLPETAQLYSKEIENDPDNVDALLDAAYTDPVFTDRCLLSLLLQKADTQ